jgi:hypothetical protein
MCEYLGRQLAANPDVIVQIVQAAGIAAVAMIAAWKATSIIPEMSNGVVAVIKAFKGKKGN